MNEQWKPMVGHPKFLVSNCGRISNKGGKIFAQWVNHEGYAQICLCENGKKFVVNVHREVAKAFLKRPDGSVVVNHIDGVKTNNSISNLEYISNSENVKHAIRLGLAVPPEPIKKAVICVETGERFESAAEASRSKGPHGSHITSCCLGKRQTCGGFHWEYAEKKER